MSFSFNCDGVQVFDGAESGTNPYKSRTARMRSSHPKGRNGARNERSGAPALARVDGDDARRRLKVRIGAARVLSLHAS